MKPQVYPIEIPEKWTNRTNVIVWCRKLQKFCSSPSGHNFSGSAQANLNQLTRKGGF